LQAEGWDRVHWSQGGIAAAPNHEVMQWALGDQRIVLTHDLDYGAMPGATENELESGASLVVDEAKSRNHLLPLASKSGP
jgi:hypothetical protein